MEDACETPPVVEFSQDLVACAGAAPGSVCALQCQPGFRASGDPVCRRGAWSQEMCEAEGCSAEQLPSIPHATESTARCSAFGTPAAQGRACLDFGCRQGYRAVGELRCVGGNWLAPRCLLAHGSVADFDNQDFLVGITDERCEGVPIVANSADLGACAGLPTGSECRLSCHPGFRATEPAVCVRGRWTGGRCEPAHCAHLPEIPHGRLDNESCKSLAPNEVCRLDCDIGYVPEGEVRCLGLAYSGARCVPAPCPQAPRIHDALDLGACAGAPSGATCSVTCREGHAKTADAVCIRGEWTPAHCEPMACHIVPAVPHATGLVQCAGAADGEFCGSFKCKAGFEQTGELECHGGHFSTASCRDRNCLGIPEVQDAHPMKCDDRHGVQVCEVSCFGDYVKSSDVVCEQGSWLLSSCLSPETAGSREAATVLVGLVLDAEDQAALGDDVLGFVAAIPGGIARAARIVPGRVRLRNVTSLEYGIGLKLELWPPASEAKAPVGGGPRSVRDALDSLRYDAMRTGSEFLQPRALVPRGKLASVEVLSYIGI